MVIEAHSSRILNEPELFSIAYNIHNYLNNSEYLSAVKSPILYYDAMHRAYYPSSFETKTYSSDKSAIKKYEKQFGSFATNNYLMNDSKTMFKFVAQMQDLGRNDIKRINNEIYNEVNAIINDSPMHAELTGIDHLIDPSRLWEGAIMALGKTAEAYGEIKPVPFDRFIEANNFTSKLIHPIITPGHSPHHVSYLVENYLFAGEAGGVFLSPGPGKRYLRPSTPPRFFMEIYINSLDKLIT